MLKSKTKPLQQGLNKQTGINKNFIVVQLLPQFKYGQW